MPTTQSPALSFRLDSNYRWEVNQQTLGAREYRAFPVRVSVPVAPGRCAADEPLELRDEKGKAVPAVVRPLATWPDGSVRVWEVWLPATLNQAESRTYTLAPRRQAAPPKSAAPTFIDPAQFTVTVTLADGTVLKREVEFHGLSSSTGPGGPRSVGAASRPRGQAPAAPEDEVEFDLVKFGEFTAFKGSLRRQTWSWYPGWELSVRLINYAPGETTQVKSVRLEFDLPGRGACRYTIKQATIRPGKPRLVESATPFIVRAEAGTARVTDSLQLGDVETDFPAYERGTYLCMVDNWTAVTDDAATWVLAVPDACERFPKGFQIDGRHVTVDLHPADAAPLEWRRGMALFQRVQLARLPAKSTAADCENEGQAWLRPPIVRIDPELYRAAGWRLPFRFEPGRFPRTELQIRELFAFGWPRGTFDWGDQLLFAKGTRNHEYDFVAVAAKEYARTGRRSVWNLCRSAAEHTLYTDFVAVSEDPWVEGGIPAHCVAHTKGSAYPSHMWAEGLMLYYLVSGDRYALTVAKRVGDFFLKYIAERFDVVNSTGREMGWTLIALAALYDVTREERYLAGIKTIVDFYLARGADNFFPLDATFAVGVGLIGLDRASRFYREPELRKFIPGVLDFLMAHRCDETGLFDYWYEAERDGFTWIQAHLPQAFAIGYRLTGDEKYLRSVWRTFQIHRGGMPLTVQNRYAEPEEGYAGGFTIAWLDCLELFAEKGWLDGLQYPEPTAG